MAKKKAAARSRMVAIACESICQKKMPDLEHLTSQIHLNVSFKRLWKWQKWEFKVKAERQLVMRTTNSTLSHFTLFDSINITLYYRMALHHWMLLYYVSFTNAMQCCTLKERKVNNGKSLRDSFCSRYFPVLYETFRRRICSDVILRNQSYRFVKVSPHLRHTKEKK